MDNYNKNRQLQRANATNPRVKLFEGLSRDTSRAFSMMAESSRNESDIMSKAYGIAGAVMLGALVCNAIAEYTKDDDNNNNKSGHNA